MVFVSLKVGVGLEVWNATGSQLIYREQERQTMRAGELRDMVGAVQNATPPPTLCPA